MSNDNNQPANPLTSLLPVLILGIGTIFLFNYLGEDSEPVQVPVNESSESANLNDFQFNTARKSDEIEVKTRHAVYVLTTTGARIDKVYLKDREEVPLPEKYINQSNDPREKQYEAIEITRGNGMDFQFHLYYRGPGASQMGNPALNNASFNVEGPFESADGKIIELVFTAPVRFNGQRLEFQKIYRFLKNESFFRQITVLRNRDNRPFDLSEFQIYYRTFGDIGPDPESENERILQTYGRFFHYDESNQQFHGIRGGGGGGFLSCGKSQSPGPYTIYQEAPDSLEFIGSNSRYLIAYSRFLPSENKMVRPDGMAVLNSINPDGRATMTAFFSGVNLEPASNKEFIFGSVSKQGLESQARTSREIVRIQQNRKDMLILDQEIYVGLRTDEAHGFNDETLASQEFGTAEIDSDLRDVIYTSGFLAVFSKIRDVIVALMRILYPYIGNYGWVIILIAVSVKLATFPLNQMQAKAMKKMSALKPEMDALNEKYADNPQEKQKRVMQLYKDHNINPAKGCLPILIQIPIFIALYSAFSESIELWKSPFILWMNDLSEPDTIYVIKDLFFVQNFHVNILPLVMVVSQLLQQKFTTVVSDPQQRMIMYIMPVVMIFFFWSMPSGVTLYWTVQNFVSIIWQLLANKFAKVED